MAEETESHEASVLAQLADELRLQAWLARAEFEHPSLEHDETRQEVSALARIRDQLRVQLHLGRLEATEEFEHLEGRWRHLKHLASRAAADVEENLHDVLRDIRDGYRKLGDRQS
jgi:predicted component of type VI protein secretion system